MEAELGWKQAQSIILLDLTFILSLRAGAFQFIAPLNRSRLIQPRFHGGASAFRGGFEALAIDCKESESSSSILAVDRRVLVDGSDLDLLFTSLLAELGKMDLLLSAIIVGAGCFALGYYIGGHHPSCLPFPARVAKDSPSTSSSKKNKSKEPLEIEKLAGIMEDFKMVLVVRNDLKMGKGKIAAQCSHATLGLYKKVLHRAPKALNRWEMCAQPKVVLKIETEEEMLVLQERAKSLKLPTHITIDAGRTQIAPNSRTVMAVLGPVEVVDDVTGGLKLL